ncbi:MAG: hypothetical protein ONB46_17120 [candidate division KSB1 bacterium]|nr:hypothetical protein [candidate division KSB1 bacterium]MDZ7367444.1 hypothetical protein [candidate division KSB1 bacterium]MDZ7405451.1 hypothetical protein [candidate division KSB1 bacterium]
MPAFFFAACNSRHAETPPFDLAGSDAKAVALADSVMAACGGRENWEKTRVVTWDWFGKRLNVWDKWTGDVRVESRRSLILMNLNTKKGRAWKDGHEITEPDKLQRALDYGYEAWANDSYWMFLPFKLKDGGVTLKYLGEGLTAEGQPAEILSVTFTKVGLTPNNKHHVYIDKASKLLVQWDFFADANDPAPSFSVPWKNYQKFGKILLSDDRGEGARKKHVGLGVFETLPTTVFNSPDPIDWMKLQSEMTNGKQRQSGG